MNKILAILIIITSKNSIATETLCGKDEKDLFGCSNGKKIISLCHAKNGDSNVLTYKFGTTENIEMKHPKNNAKMNESFRLSSRAIQGGQESRVKFNVGSYTYIVYNHETNYGHSGVLVLKNGKSISNIKCDNDATLKSEIFALPTENYNDKIEIPNPYQK